MALLDKSVFFWTGGRGRGGGVLTGMEKERDANARGIRKEEFLKLTVISVRRQREKCIRYCDFACG